MMTTKQPGALRLASELDEAPDFAVDPNMVDEAVAELRRLHAENETLRAELVNEAKRTADEKLRADQMTQQHRMQADLNTSARAELATLRTGYAAARLEIASLQAQLEAVGAGGMSPLMGASQAQPVVAVPQWVPVDERLPESGKPVLLDIGTKTPIRAMWAAKHTIEAGDDDTDWAEYVEADDMYYSPEGWYEWNQQEDTHWSVTDAPVAWMELPAPMLPAAQAQDARRLRTDVARAIWEVMREYEDSCDMELEDVGCSHVVWQLANAAIAAQQGCGND